MDKLSAALRNPAVRSIGVRLLVLYCASIGLFYAVDAGNRSAAESLKPGVKSGKVLSQAVVLCVAAASNALAVLTFVFICRRTGDAPRLAMVGLPLLFLLERHVSAGRARPDDRRLETLLALGVATGIIGAGLALMRGSPIL